MQSPKQIIENIRKIRFGIGLDTNNITEDMLAHIEDNKKFKDDASRLASDLHTEKPHFILELIQNAEDNDYDENVKPMVKFINQGDKLILQNNERGFNEKNVRALCGIGETTKQNKKVGYIGEKGTGFKSVFMVTNKPYIYSNGFQYKFNYDEKEPISIIIPEWVDDIPHFVDSNKTNIVLPLKNEVKDELIKFTEIIDPCLLLFLRKLRYIEIEDNIQNKSGVIERHDSEGRVKIVHPVGEDYWRIVKSPEPLKVPPHIKEEKRKDIIETEIVLAFPLKPNGLAETSTEQKVFVYLPVRSYGFKFIIQADFLMPPSREDIHKDETDKSWNKWLRDNIASIFLRAVEEFKQDEKLKKTYYNYIPLTNEVTDTFFSPVVEQIQNDLHEAQCILTESKIWLKPIETFRVDNETRSLIPNDDLKEFFNKEYISSDIKANKSILDALGIPEFGFNDLVQCLQKEEWLKKQNDKWFTRLYAYLNSQELKEKQMQTLENLKIIRLENNQLASVSEKNIFFPLDKIGDYGFETELRVVKRPLMEAKEKEINNAIVEFLKKLGVREAQPYEIIENHILPIYESDDENSNWKSKDNKIRLGYIRYIKENLQNYEKESDKQLNANKKFWEQKDNPLRRLKNSVYIRINKSVDGTNYYDHPDNLYLPKTYGNYNDLESLFEGIEDISFVHREYIDDVIKKYRQLKMRGKKSKADIGKKQEADIKEWRDFFVRLGINTIPKIIYKSDKIHDPIPWTQNYGYYDSKLRYMSYLPEDYFKNKYKAFEDITDYKLELDVQYLNQKQRTLLLNILEKNWGFYKNYFSKQLIYRYKYYRHKYNWTEDKKDCHFKQSLIATPWLPTTKGTFVKPSEVFLDKPNIKQLLGDSVLYLNIQIKNEEFIKTIGINSEANVDGVLNYMKGLIENKCAEKSIFIKLYEFLNKNYEENEETITAAFLENKIIYLPDTTQNYFTSREVLWKDVSEIFGENRGYLERHYPNLKSFFVEKLGVNEKPTPKDYADVLMDFSKKEMFEKNDEKIILKIYSELNSHLNPENNDHMISEEDWWNDFIKKSIFWTDKKEFWRNENNVFVNDNEELYDLFKDKSQLSFLKMPRNYYPKLQHFIETASVLYLTKATKTELYDRTKIIERSNFAKQIHKFAPYILRYLYQLEHDNYEKLKGDEILVQLKNMRCYGIEKLQVKYTLNDQTAFAQRNVIFHNGDLYIQNDQFENTDYLAVELSKLFGEIRGFDNFLISLFNKKTDENIDNLMRAKGIQELPEEEIKWFGIVEPPRKDIEGKEEGVTEIEEKQPMSHPSKGLSPIPISIETSEALKNIDEQDSFEKEEWQPEYTPEEVLQDSEKSEVLIYETKEPSNKLSSSPKPPRETKRDVLSWEAKTAIGRWGEKYILECLKKKLSAKYPEGKIEEIVDGFTINLNERTIVRVQWLNKIEDRGEGYDIKVIENNIEKYLEVKSTKTDTKDWFEVTNNQWRLMKQKEDKFHIYRVYNAGTKEAKLTDISNPYKKWQEDELTAYPIRIQI